jgi:hypothetical protein
VTEASHKRSIVVWDVPSTVECGAAFAIKAGIKCDALCPPDNWALEVRDEHGNRLACAEVGEAIWPGTEGLRRVVLKLTAPASEGSFRWKVIAPAAVSLSAAQDRSEAPPDPPEALPEHSESAAYFNVRTVPEGECCLTVIAIGRETQEPVAGAKVVAHPYRAVTDERGVAELNLPRGRHRVFVTRRNFLPLRLDRDLAGATTIRAELELDTGPSDAELWA